MTATSITACIIVLVSVLGISKDVLGEAAKIGELHADRAIGGCNYWYCWAWELLVGLVNC
jgi:hypothetical protein